MLKNHTVDALVEFYITTSWCFPSSFLPLSHRACEKTASGETSQEEYSSAEKLQALKSCRHGHRLHNLCCLHSYQIIIYYGCKLTLGPSFRSPLNSPHCYSVLHSSKAGASRQHLQMTTAFLHCWEQEKQWHLSFLEHSLPARRSMSFSESFQSILTGQSKHGEVIQSCKASQLFQRASVTYA